jgi:predicted amidohydrolase YtcJ
MSEAIREMVSHRLMRRMWPVHELPEAGVLVTAGSDRPCAQPTPSRWRESRPSSPAPTQVAIFLEFWSEQAVAGQTALQIYAANAATAVGLGSETGSLTLGKSADFIVPNQDLFSIANTSFHEALVVQTLFAGQKVHDAGQTKSTLRTPARSTPQCMQSERSHASAVR